MLAPEEFFVLFPPHAGLACNTQLQLNILAPREATIGLTACRTPFRLRVGDEERVLTAAIAHWAPARRIDARGARFLSFRVAPLHPLFRRLQGAQPLHALDRDRYADLDDALLAATRGQLDRQQARALHDTVVDRTAQLFPAPPPCDPRVTRAIEMVRTVTPEPGPAQIAAALGLSSSRLGHLFTEHVGMSLRTFQTWRRTARAWGLLVDSDIPITEIAHAMNFSDAAHFTRTFHRYTGRTPSDLREQHGPQSGKRPVSGD